MSGDKKHIHSVNYTTLILVWIGLLGLTAITVSVAGLDLGMYTLFVALTIAAIKSYLVITVFMHIKYDEPVFKLFLVISASTLIVIFILTYFDYLYR